MNKAILSGRIASDIELKTTGNGTSVCSFRIAVQRRFKNAEGNYDADFINCVAWRTNAEFISKYFKKGDPIEVGGSIQTRNYEKDGQKVYITEVVIDEAGFVLSKKESNSETETEPHTPPEDDGFMHMPMPDDPDLPF